MDSKGTPKFQPQQEWDIETVAIGVGYKTVTVLGMGYGGLSLQYAQS